MLEAEKGVIGCVLIDKESLFKIYNLLKPEMMSTNFCSDCYREILAMFDRGEEINIMTLSQNLEDQNYDAETIGLYLRECLDASPVSTMIKSYAETIIKEWKSREVKSLINRISLKPKDINDSISEMMTRLEELKENQRARSKSMKQIVEENKDKHFNPDVGKDRIRLGFYNFDECTGGIEGGDVMVLGARPGVGKSAIVAQMISNVVKQGKKVGYFNLEMPEGQVYERFVSKESQISLTRVRRAKSFLGNEEEAFNSANKTLSNMRLRISTNSRKISDIKAECKHQGYDLIVIDYLQLLQSDKRYQNRVSEVGDISKGIKSLAMELNKPIILLSQLNRTSELKPTKEPTMSELREAGDIEQDAGVIALMWNVSKKDKSLKGFKCDKNRMGITLKEGMRFDGDHMEFREHHENFERFMQMVNSINNGTDFSSSYDEDNTPFGDIGESW